MFRCYSTRKTIETAHTFVTNAGESTVQSLKNSLSSLSTVSLTIPLGPRYEAVNEKGYSQFIKALSFKGNPFMTRMQISREMENKGIRMNTLLSRESLTFTASTFSEEIPFVLTLFGNELVSFEVDQYNVDKQKDQLYLESDQANKDPLVFINEHLHETAFGLRGLGNRLLIHPYRLHHEMDSSSLMDFKKRHLKNYILSSSGPMSHETLLRLHEEHILEPLKNSMVQNAETSLKASSYIGGYKAIEADWDTNYLAVAFPVERELGSVLKALLFGHQHKYLKSHALVQVDESINIEPFLYRYSDANLLGFILSNGTEKQLVENAKTIRQAITSASKKLDEATFAAAISASQAESQLFLDSETNRLEMCIYDILYGNSNKRGPIEIATITDALKGMLKANPSVIATGPSLSGLQ